MPCVYAAKAKAFYYVDEKLTRPMKKVRLAALVLRPRLHLIRFHGVLAPNAKLRREIVPSPPEQATAPACDHAQGAPARPSWARLLNGSSTIDIEHCPNCGGSLNIAHSHNRRIELNATDKSPSKWVWAQA